MKLGDDDDMVIDDTPPKSPGDNTPLPPPASSNPPSPYHLPPRTPSPPPGSPPQSDIAKKGENSQGSPDQQTKMVVIASTLSQPKMYEAGRVETDSQKEFIIAGQDNNIPDADATTND